MCAPQNIKPAPLTLRTAARQLEDISFRMGQVAHLVNAIEDRVHDHPGQGEANDRAFALMDATNLMLTAARRQMESLVDRMLNDAQEG